jgi:NAD(P)H-flavin reductase
MPVESASKPLLYLPGQFVTIHFEFQGRVYKRSYSLSNPPEGTGRLEFAVSYVPNGVASTFLFDLKEGALLALSGPHGRFIVKPMPHISRYILVGTGTGIAPYRAMQLQLHSLLEQNASLQVAVLQGVRTRTELLYAESFRTWAQQCPRVTFRACLSREPATTTLASDERLGHVQDYFSELSLDPARDLVYLCGNPRMIDDSFGLLTQQGFSVSHLIREKYFSKSKDPS